jgi:hypothetical protein
MKVYVASSWKNRRYPAVVGMARSYGWDVYDFRNPPDPQGAFSWDLIDPEWSTTTDPARIKAMLDHPLAERGFELDRDAIEGCDALILVQPCGRSAHLELGYAAGLGKKTAVLMAEGDGPDLMYKLCDAMCAGGWELMETLNEWRREEA